MNAQLSSIAAAVACGAFVACGGSGSTGTSNMGTTPDSGSPTVDAGASNAEDASPAGDDGPPSDPGAPSNTYPAFPPDFGQVVDNGGHVMNSSTIVAITWNADMAQGSFDTFADTVGQTNYWKAATSEYGVAPAACGDTNHVHMSTAAPAQVTDQDIQNMVIANAGGTAAVVDAGGSAIADAGAGASPTAWPTPTQNTIYSFFLPPGTSLQIATGQGGSTMDACAQGIGGYHDQVTVGGVTTSYAVVPSCTFPGGNTAAQQSTMSMSHELIEAVTDPDPQETMPGYVGFDNGHFGFDWFQEFSSEVGDACELFKQSFFEDQETSPVAFDYWVQRTWSNKAGPAGHDPCQPAPATPYFNVTPLNLDMVTLTLPAQLSANGAAQNLQTKGLHIANGATATLDLGFYSDGPTGGPWTLSYTLGSPISQKKQTYLNVTLDRTSGQNGEKAHAAITVTSVGSLKGELLVFHSTMNGVTHYMPVVVGSE
jgi:hypothetical protein